VCFYYPVSVNRKRREKLKLVSFHEADKHVVETHEFADFHILLAEVIVEGMNKLLDWGHGYPSELNVDTWDMILRDIRDDFQKYIDTRDTIVNVHYPNKGFDLLKKWFPHMWD
jgi:hypothetical protein